MKTSTKFGLVTLAVGIPAFLLGRVIWPDPEGGMALTGAQTGLLILYSAIDSLAFGLAAAFLVFGWPMVNRISGPGRNMAILRFLAVVWLVGSWWPHDNLHRHIGHDVDHLIQIEYGFHLTMIIAALIIADFAWKGMKGRGA